MPIPKPRTGESQSKFMTRCMSDGVMKREYPDEKQRNAICYSAWDHRNALLVEYLLRQGWSDGRIYTYCARFMLMYGVV